MSDCLPCKRKMDPAFLEKIKKQKEEAQKLKDQSRPPDQGTLIKKEGENLSITTSFGTNTYNVVSKEDNKLVVKLDGDLPIRPVYRPKNVQS